MRKSLRVLVVLSAVWAVVTMSVLYCRTPFGYWNDWQYLYQSAWNSLAGASFYAAISLWFIGFYEWWKLERRNLTWREIAIMVIPATLFFWGGIGKGIADFLWCIIDCHTCHAREFVDGEIEKTVVNVGLCAVGSAWALVSLARQYALKTAMRKEVGPLLFWWSIPMTILAAAAFYGYHVAIHLDDCMGEGWKYAFLDSYDWMILLMLHWLTLAVYWACWIKEEPGFWRPMFRRPVLLLWTLIASSCAYMFLERMFR